MKIDIGISYEDRAKIVEVYLNYWQTAIPLFDDPQLSLECHRTTVQ